jgi:ATP:corrinoid adenosyltransferase
MAEATSEKSDKQQELKNSDDVALELMKFIAVTTGYGKGTPTAGFGGKGQRSSEEYADSLLELFERCRAVVKNSK